MKKLIINITLALFPLAGGILLIAFPDRAVMLAFLVLSLFLIVSGVKNLWYSASMTGLPRSVRSVGMVKNTVSLVIGCFTFWKALARPEGLLNMVVYILAAYLLLNSIMDFVDTAFMRRLGLSNGIAADGLTNAVFAVVLFCFPHLIGSTFLTIFGIVLLLFGTLLLAGAIFSRKAERNRPRDKGEPIDVDWEER